MGWIFIFSIVLGAEYSFYLKSIATYAPAFLGYNNSVLARVALDARMRGCLNITPAQKWYAVIFQISAEKSFQA